MIDAQLSAGVLNLSGILFFVVLLVLGGLQVLPYIAKTTIASAREVADFYQTKFPQEPAKAKRVRRTKPVTDPNFIPERPTAPRPRGDIILQRVSQKAVADNG